MRAYVNTYLYRFYYLSLTILCDPLKAFYRRIAGKL
jgi:hypothetical protein